jgi:hypothetical protein
MDSSSMQILQPSTLLQINTLERSFPSVNRYPTVSAMVYTTSYLLVLIKKGGYPNPISPIQPAWWWPFSKTELKQLDKTELVMVGENIRPKTNIPVDKLLEFLDANTEAFSIDKEIVGKTVKNTAALSKDKEIVGKDEEGEDCPEYLTTRAALVCTMMVGVKGSDSFLWTIDYNFGETDIVYYVTVNRDLKRVTVSFRGSVTGKDWMQNLQIVMTELKTPTLLAKQGFNETIKVHRGFKSKFLRCMTHFSYANRLAL